MNVSVPWMDHVDTMFESNANDVVLCEICTDRSKAFSNLIRFVRLYALSVPS